MRKRNKLTAGILAIVLGNIGIHNFYIGRIWLGILDVLFCWTYIPGLIALIKGILWLTSTDEEFEESIK